MTHKIIFSCTAAIMVAAVAGSSADAHGFGGGFHGLRGGSPGGIGTAHVNPGFGARHNQTVSLPGGGHQPPGSGLPGGGHQPPGGGLPGGGHQPPGGSLPGGGHHHSHGHWLFQDGSWIYVDAPADVTPAAVPGPCTCLTKTYTPSGLVVFADICTKESASALASDDSADVTTAPSTAVPAMDTPISEVPTVPNYAGRTYQDYLAANPKLARPQTSVQTLEQNQPEK
jgi:hypothetical protein